jgi:hypothetical protein
VKLERCVREQHRVEREQRQLFEFVGHRSPSITPKFAQTGPFPHG